MKKVIAFTACCVFISSACIAAEQKAEQLPEQNKVVVPVPEKQVSVNSGTFSGKVTQISPMKPPEIQVTSDDGQVNWFAPGKDPGVKLGDNVTVGFKLSEKGREVTSFSK